MLWKTFCLSAAAATVSAGMSIAQTEIQWWHAMGGTNGERVDKIAADFNASQSDYTVVPSYKGNYTETMTAAVAAFRANEQPHLVQVFEVGTATMMAAKGAVYPVEKMMADAGEPFDKSDYLPAVISYYQTSEGELLSMPFNSSTPVLWYNADALSAAGVAPILSKFADRQSVGATGCFHHNRGRPVSWTIWAPKSGHWPAS